MKGDIILRYSDLRANLNDLFPQIMYVGNLFDDRDSEVKTWLHYAIELLETMD